MPIEGTTIAGASRRTGTTTPREATTAPRETMIPEPGEGLRDRPGAWKGPVVKGVASRTVLRVTVASAMAARVTVSLAVGVVASLATSAAAQEGSEPASGSAGTLRWTATGFSNPESVLEDAARGVLYVSNVNGGALDRDGNGFLSRLSPDGTIEALQFVGAKGGAGPMDAPKGMAMDGPDTLYVADIDRLHRVDLAAGAIVETFEARGAMLLDDPSVSEDGDVYVSDIAGRTIWRLRDGAMELWLEDDALMHPNGTRVEDGRLLVAGWGRDMRADGTASQPGHLFTIDLADKSVDDLGSGAGIGHLDGVEPDGSGNYLVTDAIAGALYRVHTTGEHDLLLDLDPGSADLEVTESGRLAIIPQAKGNRVDAYDLIGSLAVDASAER